VVEITADAVTVLVASADSRSLSDYALSSIADLESLSA